MKAEAKNNPALEPVLKYREWAENLDDKDPRKYKAIEESRKQATLVSPAMAALYRFNPHNESFQGGPHQALTKHAIEHGAPLKEANRGARETLGEQRKHIAFEPLNNEFNLNLPDFKKMTPGSMARFVEVKLGPADNPSIEKHYTEALVGKDLSKFSDFDKQKLYSLAICDVFTDKYQQALSKQEVDDARASSLNKHKDCSWLARRLKMEQRWALLKWWRTEWVVQLSWSTMMQQCKHFPMSGAW